MRIFGVNCSLWTRIFRVSLFVCISFLGFLFFIAPTRQFHTLAGDNLDRYHSPMMVVFLLGAFSAYLLSRLFEAPGVDDRPLKKSTPPHRSLDFAKLALSLGILFLAFQNSQGPLEWDENSVSTLFPKGSLTEILNPFRGPQDHEKNTNQSIATGLSYLSQKALGLKKASLRLPSLLTLVIFLGLLFRFTKNLTPFTTLLLYGHLCLNQVFLWYVQIAKGYVYMMTSSLALLLMLQNPHGRKSPWAFAAILVLCIFSHTFGALFSVTLFLALMIWLWRNQDTTEKEALRYYRERLLILIASLPLTGLVCLFHLVSMEKRAEIHTAPTQFYPALWSGLLGLNTVVWAKALLVLGTFLLVKSVRHSSRDLLFVLVLVAFVFFQILTASLGVLNPYPRVMLAFLVPLLIWVGEYSAQLQEFKYRYLLLTGLAGLFWVVPFLQGQSVRSSILANYLPFDNYITQAREIVKQTPRHCLFFHGRGEERKFAEVVHFPRPEITSESPCAREFHLLLASEPVIRNLPLEKFFPENELSTLFERYNDQNGRLVFERSDRLPAPPLLP